MKGGSLAVSGYSWLAGPGGILPFPKLQVSRHFSTGGARNNSGLELFLGQRGFTIFKDNEAESNLNNTFTLT